MTILLKSSIQSKTLIAANWAIFPEEIKNFERVLKDYPLN